MAIKSKLISAGFAGFRASGLHRLAGAATRGLGAILTFHRVRPWRETVPGYAPNRLLEITPEFLDETLRTARRLGFDFVDLDEARRRILHGGAPFVALTFDDGYRDTRDWALPILEGYGAPFCLYAATGFLDGAADLWWLDLEAAIGRLDRIDAVAGGRALSLPARDAAEKSAAFERVYWALRARPEAELLAAVGRLTAEARVDSRADADALFLDWDELAALAGHPLATIGAHSRTHRRLAQWPELAAREEMAGSRAALAERLGVRVDHFAYPVGDASSAGKREFALARDLGFATAVTTRPGMIFAEHAEHLTALPRVSINGRWQSAGAVEVLLSGAPFWLWNRGRRVDAA